MNRLLSAARPSFAAATRSRAPAVSPSVLYAIRHSSSTHPEESFQEFSARYTAFFQTAGDLFELQRGLNNCFAYDLVPGVDVIEAALRAARRVDDYSTAVRIFEGLKEKVENQGQYKQYVDELAGVRQELGTFIIFGSIWQRPSQICNLHL